MWKAHGKDGLVVIGVALDSPENARAFVKQHALTYPVVIDDDYSLAEAFGVAALPFNAVVGADGKVKFAEAGGEVDTVKARALEALAEARKKKDAEKSKKPANERER